MNPFRQTKLKKLIGIFTSRPLNWTAVLVSVNKHRKGSELLAEVQYVPLRRGWIFRVNNHLRHQKPNLEARIFISENLKEAGQPRVCDPRLPTPTLQDSVSFVNTG